MEGKTYIDGIVGDIKKLSETNYELSITANGKVHKNVKWPGPDVEFCGSRLVDKKCRE
jgi:hypothetical protein